MIQDLIQYTRQCLDSPTGEKDRLWYQHAREWLNELDTEHDLPPGTAAGVCAALSPLNSWEIQTRDVPRIIRGALPLIREGQRPHAAIVGPGFFRNKDKAARILAGEDPRQVLSGLKVTSFWLNLTGDLSAVTIDRHAVAIVGWQRSLTPAAYRRLAFAYREAAHAVGIAPAECQAVTWAAWRRKGEAAA